MIRALTLALDESPAAVIITDTAGRIEYVNQRFSQITGYASSEALGQTPSILRSGHVKPEVYGHLWRTIRAGHVWHGELQNRRKNGELFLDSVTILPVCQSGKRISHYLAVQEDVTERRQAELALRESEEHFRQLVENIPEVFFVMDATLTAILYVSPAFERVCGGANGTPRSPRSLLARVLPADRSRVLELFTATQAGRRVAGVECRIRAPESESRWVSIQAAPILDRDGLVYRITGVAADITERHRARAALEESESRFRNLTEASFDGVCISSGGGICEVNSGFGEMFGYSVPEIVGLTPLDFVGEESRDLVRHHVEQNVEGTFEFVGRCKDGRRVTIEATSRNHTVGGRPGRITALRDVTERRTLEEQFRQAQKMEAVGRLAGGVAHDFNNLLTVISGSVQMLLSDMSHADPRRDDLLEIEHAAERATSLTRQLLAFSRQQVIEPRRIVLQHVVASAEKLLKRLIGEDITLNAALPQPALEVLIDPGQLEQIIMNLAVNARDAMPTGGHFDIQLSVMESVGFPTVSGPVPPGRFAVLAVTDTGIGMDEQTRVRIFEPFFTTKEPGKGTGLGLATVYGIVRQSGGFIDVESQPGCGATFRVYLPLLDGVEESALEPVGDLGMAQGCETILLAEDAPSVRKVVRTILERCGYSVIEAASGNAALAIALDRGRAIDLLVTDVVMPGMSGCDLATRFSSLRPDVPVLYISGYTDDAVLRHGLARESVAYVQKPFAPSMLARRVRELLDGRSPKPH